MKKIKLTEDQKKAFEKYNLYLNAVLGDEGMHWYAYVYYDDGIDHIEGPTPNGPNGWERKSDLSPEEPGYDILNELANEIIRSNEDNFYDFLDDDYARNGNVNLQYNPQTKTFNLDFDVNVRQGEDSENTKTFDEIVNQPLPWYAGNQERLYSKLIDEEYIQKLIDEHGGKTQFEFPYNGYGDSGEIDSNLPYNDDLLNIAYEIIDLYHGGWENNEGGDGTVMINLETKDVSIYHTQYYEDTERQEIDEFQIV